NVVVDIVSTPGGSSIANATKDASTLTTGALVSYNFSTSATITNGNTYYIQVTRSGVRDTSNYLGLGLSVTDTPSQFGLGQIRANNTWGNDTNAFNFAAYTRQVILQELSFISVS